VANPSDPAVRSAADWYGHTGSFPHDLIGPPTGDQCE